MAQAMANEMGAVSTFVQFHPSYDYTDFVEGLRPIEKSDGQMGFERKDGVFKEFCKEAVINIEDSLKSKKELEDEHSLRDKYNELIDKIENGEVQEIPLKTEGMTMEIVRISDNNNIVLRTSGKTDGREYIVSFDRLAKLAKVYPDEESLNSISNIHKAVTAAIRGCHSSSYWAVLYEVYRQGVTSSAEKPSIIKKKPFVFIIDEINRGEASKIFGELFFAIDPGYRGKTDVLVQTQYQNLVPETDVFAKGFYVPENVYILATMNDIDRSVESMDFAMRRRFTWHEITPDDTESMLDSLPCADEAKERMHRLNNAIAETDGLGAAYMIGPAYFLKLDKNGGDFEKLWKMNIQPLLKEYLRGFRRTEEILEKFSNAYLGKTKETATGSSLLEDEN
jgi:5-methylcytosine-specific restriction endonuclease McrBC GTP-binding regulatory subunit McrB